MKVFEELSARGLIDKITHQELIDKLNNQSLKFYIGFDPTASSFHVGQLAVFNLMRILQNNNHQPIALMGAGTAMIGDPSGKNSERQLLSIEQINANIKQLTPQFEKILNPPSAKVKPIFSNNYDWINKLNTLDFLRDVGKCFPVSKMLSKESISARLNRPDGGITFTEFSYMILQAYDFAHLSKAYDCNLQMGGSDQWGNIVAGIELTRRLSGKQVYGLTMPLLTKKNGQKFGKSEAGAIWLSADKTSPYQFYQFFLRQADDDVIRLLKMLTLIPLKEIDELEDKLSTMPEKRHAQTELAVYLTELVHGSAEVIKCQRASKALYGGKLDDLSGDLLAEVFADVPAYQVTKDKLIEGWDVIDMLVEVKACRSKREARQLMQGGGIYINNQGSFSAQVVSSEHLLNDQIIVVRVGKKKYYLIKFS
ncbi:MAG: tyrosine--tRNA ligase [SAR324 cluster bacterium]|nr:tyrosine--tRNA ligase [SAR324 cluster bacterium]